MTSRRIGFGALAAVLVMFGASCESAEGDSAGTDAGSEQPGTPDAPDDAFDTGSVDGSGRELPEPKSVVFVGAHPDDELYAAPWLGYLCVEKQASCTLLILTRGESGNCKLPAGCSPDLATVRDGELAQSAQLFGAQLVHWDLGDGNAGDPAGVLESWAALAGGELPLVQDVQAVIAGAERVVTFDPRHGDSCHADHRAAGALAIVAALDLAGESGVGPGVTLVASKGIATPATSDPAIVAFDASVLLTATSEPAWSFLSDVLETHPSQFSPDEVTAVKNVPPVQQKTYLLDLKDAVEDDPKYVGLCP